MYLRQSKQTRADGSTLSHLQIAESVWDPLKKRSCVRIVYNCGCSDDPEVTERLRRLARSILKRCSPEAIVAQDPSWRVLDAWPYGDVHVLEHLWRRVGLPELIGELVGTRKRMEEGVAFLPQGRAGVWPNASRAETRRLMDRVPPCGTSRP